MALDGSWRLNDPATRNLSASELYQTRLRHGDLVITKSSGSEKHLGKTALVTHDLAELGCSFSNFMQRLRLRHGNDPRFYFYLLNSPVAREQLLYLGSTTTGLANLSGTIIGNVLAPAPPPQEQRVIADFLDRETVRIDRLVEQKRRLLELFDEKRTAMITRAVTKGLDPDVEMKESGVEWLGEVPAHWELVQLKRAVTLQRGHDLPTEERDAGEVPVVSSAGISGTHSIAAAKAPGLVTGRYGSIGIFYLLEEDYWPLTVTQHSTVSTCMETTSSS